MKKFQNDEHGLAHVALVVIVVVVLAAVGFAGWTVMKKNKANSILTTEEAKEANAACLAEIDDEDFCLFATSWVELGAYTAVMNSTSAEGASTITIRSDGNDRNHMATSVNGATVAEYITIGNTSYAKDPNDGAWTKHTSDENETADIKDDIAVKFSENTPEEERIQYKRVGKEACGNLTCFKYQLVDPKNPGHEQFVWFDDKDYLMRRWTYKNEAGTTDSTFSYDAVSISEPSPIKETNTPTGMPSAEDLQEYLNSLPSSEE